MVVRAWRQLAAPLACALVVRLLLLALIAYSTKGGDMEGYELLGQNIVEHGEFSTSRAAPFVRLPLMPRAV